MTVLTSRYLIISLILLVLASSLVEQIEGEDQAVGLRFVDDTFLGWIWASEEKGEGLQGEHLSATSHASE